MRAYALGLLLASSASPCLAEGAKAPDSYGERYERAWTLANGGNEQGIRALYELRRESSSEDAQALVSALYGLLHRFPDQWVRALAATDRARLEGFLEHAGLGYEVPASCASPEACSNEIIARLEKLRGTAEEKRITRLVIATLRRTMKG